MKVLNMDKRKFEQFKKMMRFLIVALLIVAVTVIFIWFWKENYNGGIVFPFHFKGYWLMGAFYMFFFSLFVYIYGGTGYGYLKNTNIIFSQALALGCANVLIYLETVLLSVRFVSIVPMIETTLLQLVLIVIYSACFCGLFKKIFPPHKITVLYEEHEPTSMLGKVQTRGDRYRIKDVYRVDKTWEELCAIIDNSEAIMIYDVHAELRNKLVKYCYEKDVRLYITPKISDILVRSSENIHLFDTPLLLSRNNGMSFEQKFFKRLLDIVVSLVVIVVTSPFMLIIAIAIKAYDKGPVFFKQKRCTLNGEVFEIHKFRSMIVDAEKEGISIPASEKDPRITPVGNIIRATRLDELPQIFDILSGKMSLVGPRPERIEHVEKYTNDIPEFAYRLKVKGGLTGYAQIFGKYNTTAYDKLKLDLMYIQNYSILLDLKLILMTIKIIFMKESTEGFDEKQITEIQSREK